VRTGAHPAGNWRIHGSQVSAVSHGSSTTRLNGINMINTGRKIG
jgi:hypothetical protein